MKINKSFFMIQILVLLSFTIVSLGLVFSNGICCGDDAFHAIIAKDLANGLGYTSTVEALQSKYSFTSFDPLLGTGPTIILPAALVIKLVGNTYWAPGVSLVILWSLLLLSIVWYLNKIFKSSAYLTLTIITFFFLAYIFMAYHFEQWYALLGEIPAALLIVLAVLVYLDSDSKVNLLLTGFLFSLACLAKLIAFIPFVSFLFFIFIYQGIQYKNNLKGFINPFFYTVSLISLGFIIPQLLFEFWKLVTLGFTGYLNNWSQFLKYISGGGFASAQRSLITIGERIYLIQARFGVFLPFIFLLLIGIGFSVRKDKKVFYLFCTLATMITIYTAYWLLFSNGWARYYIISMILIIFILSLPFLSTQIQKSGIVLYLLIIILMSVYNSQKIDITYPFRDLTLFKPTQYTQALNDVSRLLSSELKERPFVTQWWASAADVEYLLDTPLNFTTYWDPEINVSKPIIFIANSKFLNETDAEYQKYQEQCNMNDIGQYIYGQCHLTSSP